MQTRVLLDSYQTDYNRLKVKAAKATWSKAEETLARARKTPTRSRRPRPRTWRSRRASRS
ncbi:hypothetical protein [Salinicola tamaricis]|uniref:hypothetical protein n=1 Tax=Salinicola tamaricis TaxID=1771309 RepID=UPI0013EAA2EA|nr:hypothetical protein [Salinicola tamaricis]